MRALTISRRPNLLPALACLCLLALAACSRPDPVAWVVDEPAGESWWLRIRFRPAFDSIRGVPLADIEPGWDKATEFRAEYFPYKVARQAALDLEKSGSHLSLLGDFNTDGDEDLALAGVFRDKSGQSGSFVLILTREEGGGWRKAHLATHLGDASFAVLDPVPGGVQAWWCLECDYYFEIRWDEQTRSYQTIASTPDPAGREEVTPEEARNTSPEPAAPEQDAPGQSPAAPAPQAPETPAAPAQPSSMPSPLPAGPVQAA